MKAHELAQKLMIEPKVGQIWNRKDTKDKEIIVSIGEDKWAYTNRGPRLRTDFTENFTLNKEETLKYLKKHQEQINQQIEELSKPEIVKHKFEVIVHAPKEFNANKIKECLEIALSSYWDEGEIASGEVNLIQE